MKTNPLRIFQSFTSLSIPARYLILSNFITNIGNGIHILIVGKLLYDITGTLMSFAFVIIFEYVIKIILQLFAGSMVDKGNPKRIALISDFVRGIILILAGFFLSASSVYFWVLLISLVINIAKPFYRSSIFSIVSIVTKDDELIKYNVFVSFSIQTGQILGSALASIILMHTETITGFFINGLSYLLAGSFILMAKVPTTDTQMREPFKGKFLTFSELYQDWKGFITYLREKPFLFGLLFLSSGDFIIVNCINLFVVPIISEKLDNNYYWLFFMDSGFTIGAILCTFIATKLISKVGKYQSIVLGTLFQALSLIVIGIQDNPIIIILMFILIGAMNTITGTVSMAAIQSESDRSVKGKVSSMQHMLISLVIAISLPVISHLHRINLSLSIYLGGILIILFSIGYLILGRKKLKTTKN